MGWLDRFVLYLIALALAVAVALFAWRDSGEQVSAESIRQAIEGALAALGETVKSDVEALISAHDAETKTALSGVNATVAKTIADSLDGVEGRIADAVVEKLVKGVYGGCTATLPDECPPPSCSPSDCPIHHLEVESRHTLLYENARLIEEKVTIDSLGVKLARRHIKRLELLTNALQPCHRADAPVVFRVTGYSSTAEFRSEPSGEPLPHSDRLNLETANLRARIVGEYLKSLGFTEKTKQWSSADDMQRPYRDDAQPGMAQQALNRTVFLDIESAGACDLGP